MKLNQLALLFFTLITLNVFSQISEKRKYIIKTSKTRNYKTYIINEIPFSKLDSNSQKEIKNNYPINKPIPFQKSFFLNSLKITYTDTIIITDSFFDTLKVRKELYFMIPGFKVKAKLKINNDTLYCNPVRYEKPLYGDIPKNVDYFIRFNKNNDKQKIQFREWSFNLTYLPLKYRPKPYSGYNSDLTADININIFTGLSFGSSRFTKGNKILHDNKLTIGVLIGASQTTLNSSNSQYAHVENIKKGIFTYGLGMSYNCSKFDFGLFVGRDLAVGKYADGWIYNNKAWFGIGFGYNLFTY